MPGFSNVYEYYILEGVLRGIPLPVDTLEIRLFTAVTNAETGAGTEVTGSAYAPQPITFDEANASASANNTVITFPVATTDYSAPVTHYGIRLVNSLDRVTALTALDTPRTVLAGQRISFAIGSIVVRFTS